MFHFEFLNSCSPHCKGIQTEDHEAGRTWMLESVLSSPDCRSA
jgi:hypothetical protein